MNPGREILNYNQIKRRANRFLRKYHPEDILPIPIEEIVDLKMGIYVIPLPGLHKMLEYDEIDDTLFLYACRKGRRKFFLVSY